MSTEDTEAARNLDRAEAALAAAHVNLTAAGSYLKASTKNHTSNHDWAGMARAEDLQRDIRNLLSDVEKAIEAVRGQAKS